MSRFKLQRGSIRRNFTRAYNELKEEQNKDEGDKNAINVLWKRLEDRFMQLDKIDEEILRELGGQEEISQENMDEEYDSIQEYRDKWNDINSTEFREPVFGGNRANSSRNEGEPKSRYKLPKLKLVEFSGSPKDWLNFWSQFKGIHEDENLSEEEKFQYLIQATTSESVARRVVTSFPPTKENYIKAIEHLKSRFGKEKVLVEVYVRDLLKLVLTNTNGSQKLPLSTLYDKLETQLRALESLGVTTDKYAAMLYPLVESALSEDILVAWERIRNQIGITDAGNEDQLKQLMEFLRSEVESSERLKMAKYGITSDDEDTYNPPRKQPKLVFETVTTTDLFNEERTKQCLFCGKLHYSQDCGNIQKLTLKERFAKIREAGKCFRCLKGNHFARTCRTSVKCPICSSNHYKLLCKGNNDQQIIRKINHSSTYFGFEKIIYQTLTVTLGGQNFKQAVRAMIDTASGRSYITSQAVNNFGFHSVGTVELAHSLFGGKVQVQLLLAKSRVATIKPITIPRLELVACECGAKMANYFQKTIDMTNTELYLWSDSGNALSWIKRNENWQVFVYNRVKTINELTKPEEWLHIPGNLNPADLPSRGCSNKRLLEGKWWEGPTWLKKDKKFWPKSEINCDEQIVMSEKRKVVVSHLTQELESDRYLQRFSNLRKVIRMIAWIRRWKNYKRDQKPKGKLSAVEEQEAEYCLWRMVQKEAFSDTNKVLTQLNAEKDEFGLWRVKTKLLLRRDTEGFRRPILLPKEHLAVVRLIKKEHLEMRHCDAQILRSTLRERFWIIGSRVITRQVVTGCKRCIRFKAKHLTAPAATLPLNRVKDAAVFEVTGIDLGGPLYLANNKKAWFVIFTCAVYRAIHLELVTSLSTQGFIQSLRRFIARRGRPDVIYTDNGSNFKGTDNLMNQLDWEEIMAHSEAKRIRWIFNPPSAPWWGGWWERIVCMIKQLLRRNLAREVLDYEEMTTVLCEFEQILNSRPLSYLSENPEELLPITPMMFLTEIRSNEVIDLDKIESNAFGKKYKYRQEIRQELRERFRKDYLSLLVHKNVRSSGHNAVKVGDIVIMELENKKRVHWPIARVIQTFPSTDGVIRSVKIKIFNGGKTTELDRPIQRLHMLESSVDDIKQTLGDKVLQIKASLEQKEKNEEEEHKVTRSGRKIQKPTRLGF